MIQSHLSSTQEVGGREGGGGEVAIRSTTQTLLGSYCWQSFEYASNLLCVCQ